jgi:hypothetical protein
LFADGKPVAGGELKFEFSPNNLYEDFTAETDKQGRFAINVPRRPPAESCSVR